MESVIADRLRNARSAGARRGLLIDTLRSAPREHASILNRDLRHSLRLFARAPGFVAAVLLALALGVGASVSVFSIVNAVLLRSLPYGDAGRLVYMWSPLPRYSSLPREMGPSFADVNAWQTMSHSFSAITAFQQSPLTLYTAADPVREDGAFVQGNFLATLEVKPLLGRGITDSDDSPAANPVAVISYDVWRRQFGQNPDIIGHRVKIGRTQRQIVGVMPPGFNYPHASDFPGHGEMSAGGTGIWVPVALTPQQQANRMLLASAVLGRLRPTVSLGQAQTEMSKIAAQLDPRNVPEMRGTQSYLVSMVDSLVGPSRTLLELLSLAVGLVLLVACGNAANLLLARAVDRSHEMGIRIALGAPRARLVRQLLTESLLLAVGGGILGTALAVLATKALAAIHPANLPRIEQATVDGRVLAVACALTLGTGVLFGVLPALAASRTRISEWLRVGGSRVAGGHARMRQLLIVGNVAMAVLLLVGAGLLIKSYVHIQREAKGFSPTTLTVRVALDQSQHSQQQAASLFRQVQERIATLPGVAAVGSTNHLPLTAGLGTSTFSVEGYANQDDQQADWQQVSGDFLQAMATPLLQGRPLNWNDMPTGGSNAAPPVIVSAAFAKRYFPHGHALGGHLHCCLFSQQWLTIVGVAADVRRNDLESVPLPTIYIPSRASGNLAIATSLPPATLIPAIRQVLRGLDPTLTLADIRTMAERSSESEARRRFQTVILAGFAAIAVLLALIGLYGLLAYTVRQRTAEIGVRIALGAARRDVIAMVVRQGLAFSAAGLAIGLALTVVASRSVSSLLYGVSALDPITLAAVTASMLAAAGIASFIPARRAAAVDPVRALRQD